MNLLNRVGHGPAVGPRLRRSDHNNWSTLIMRSPAITTFTLAAALAFGVAACSDDDKKKDPPAGCTPGTTTGCAAGQICGSDGTCQAATSGMITIATASARSCELLFEQAGTTIVDATWGTGVKGAVRKRPPNVAIAISRTSDAAFGADAVTLQLDGAPSGVSLTDARCFDASGAVIDNADVSFSAGS
jgi:hypothetical protein